MIELIHPNDNADICLMTPIQKEFVKQDKAGNFKSVADMMFWEKVGSSHRSETNVSVYFKWTGVEIFEPMSLEFSFEEDFGELCPKTAVTVGDITYSTEDGGCFVARVDNLMMGKRYFWRVRNGESLSEVRSFTTQRGEIRAMRIPHMVNVRDIGGRMTKYGKYVKQGMIFRGPAFEQQIYTDVMNECTRRYFLENMGIKTDIDLREEAVGKVTRSALSPDTKYYLCEFKAGGGIFCDVMQVYLPQIFEILADESNYPIYFHCAAGADRTGTLAWVLESVLGESLENISMDYDYTSVSGGARCWRQEGHYTEFGFDYCDERYPGLSVPEQMVMAMTEYVGIPEETIEKIRSIMLE